MAPAWSDPLSALAAPWVMTDISDPASPVSSAGQRLCSTSGSDQQLQISTGRLSPPDPRRSRPCRSHLTPPTACHACSIQGFPVSAPETLSDVSMTHTSTRHGTRPCESVVLVLLGVDLASHHPDDSALGAPRLCCQLIKQARATSIREDLLRFPRSSVLCAGGTTPPPSHPTPSACCPSPAIVISLNS